MKWNCTLRRDNPPVMMCAVAMGMKDENGTRFETNAPHMRKDQARLAMLILQMGPAQFETIKDLMPPEILERM